MKPKLGYVLCGRLASASLGVIGALRANGSGFSSHEEPLVFKSRPEAAKALKALLPQYRRSPVKLSVVPLRDWDRRRIQDMLSEPRS